MSLTGLALFSGANAPPGHGLPQIAPVLPVPRAQPAAPTRAASVTKVVAPVVAPILRHGQSASWVPGRVSPDVEWPLKDDVTAAYSLAVAVSPSGCHLPVTLLMAIGQVESGNLAGHALDASHRAAPPILGPVLDGSAWSAVTDSDGGRLDGNTRWDRAVGPMQFIPESWRVAGVDMDGDGTRDPQDIYDAAGAAMVYLCAGGRDLATTAGLRSAILGFNHSEAYLRVVLRQKAAYDAAAGSLGAPYAALGLGLASQQAAPEGVLQHSGTAGARPHDATPMSPTAPAAQQGSTSTSVIPATRPTTSPQPLPSASPEPTGNPTTSTPGDPVPTPEPIPTPDPTPAPDQDPTPVPTREPTPEPTPLPPCPTDIPTPALVIDPTTPVPADPAATCLPVPTPTSTP